MTISLIVALSENSVIGQPGRMLPWRLTADLRHFREVTTGHSIIMGRKTYDTIGRPLPGRTNIIVTRNTEYSAPGALVEPSLEAALAEAKSIDSGEIFIAGGGSIYEQALPLANKLYLTRVHSEVKGSVFFHFDPGQWRLLTSESHTADGTNEYDFTWETYSRK